MGPADETLTLPLTPPSPPPPTHSSPPLTPLLLSPLSLSCQGAFIVGPADETLTLPLTPLPTTPLSFTPPNPPPSFTPLPLMSRGIHCGARG